MFTREKYCAICGCAFSVPDLRDPVNPDPDENLLPAPEFTYDSRILPQKMVDWLTDFRVVGRWEEIDSSLVNVSSSTSFFISPPAVWEYGWGIGEPSIPTIAGKTVKRHVYEPADDDDGMLFPIHKACLDILERLRQLRQVPNEAPHPSKPKTLEAFCEGLRQQRIRNFTEPDDSRSWKGYYGSSGGIEWLHGYYGARQFWTDEWDTEPGWELLCADPSPLKIPDLPSYLRSELPKSTSSIAPQASSQDQIADRLGWLFPEEVETITSNEMGNIDWEKGIEILLEKADRISADEGGMEEGNKKLASAPLGLKNRWRIWKILQGIRLSD